jgi:hypothetical protein
LTGTYQTFSELEACPSSVGIMRMDGEPNQRDAEPR